METIKNQIAVLERKVIALQTSAFVVLLTAEQKADLETAEKELAILYKKERLDELRKELRAERISTGELLELQSLIPYIDKVDVELLEAAGVPEFDEDETTDLFDTPELIPDNVQAILERYTESGDELSYTELAAMHVDCEAVGYTFDYYLDATPYNLRKIELCK